jgi:hypothetical protein
MSDLDIDFQSIAGKLAKDSNASIYVVPKGGSYLYLTFADDFDWNEVVFVAKP